MGFLDDDGPFLAGAVAYQIFFALVPLLALLIGLFAVVYGQQRAERELTDMVQSLYPSATGQETRIVRQLVDGRALSLGIGLVGTIFSVTAILGSIDSAMAHILGREGKRPFVRDRLMGLTFVVLVLVLAIASFAISYGLQLVAHALPGAGVAGVRLLLELASPLVGLAVGFQFFYLVYRLAPRRSVRPPTARRAALVSAVLWEVAKVGFGYLTRALALFEAYGPLAFAAGLLTWIYLTAAIILIGAEVLKTRNA